MSKLTYLKTELNSIQKEYKELVIKGDNNLKLNYYSCEQCRFFLDEVKRFWLERRDILRFCWDRLTDEADCFILSAAIYLKVESGNHYSLKAVGDYQLLPDPFLKMEQFLRAPVHVVDAEEVERQFRSIVNDTLKVLEDYSDDLLYIDLAAIGGASGDDHRESIHKSYINFLKQSFEREDLDNVANEMTTYEEIERALHPNIRDSLIFIDHDDISLSLGERVEGFLKKQKTIGMSFISDNVFDKFSMAVFCLYAQAVDTILKCQSVGVYPFFRNEVPAKYFIMLTFGYHDDKAVLEFIWKAIIAYFIGKEIEQIDTNNISFNDFTLSLVSVKPYEIAIKSLQSHTNNFANCSIKDVSEAVKPAIMKLRYELGR